MRSGGRLQAGIPKEPAAPPGPNHGLVRAVVVATYCVDDPQHPLTKAGVTPTAVYCDLLVYSSASGGSRFFFLPGAAVAQPLGGLHKGAVFKPKAATRLLNGKALSDVTPQDVAALDGDFVLVALADGRTNQPIVIATLPHPSRDVGNPSTLPAGQRQQLRLEDGDPMLLKHLGCVFGIDAGGNYVVDTTRASDGTLTPAGGETPAAVGAGCATWNLAAASVRTTRFCPPSPGATAQAILVEALSAAGGYALDYGALGVAWQVLSRSGNALNLTGSGSSARLQLGDGAVHAVVAEAMQALWSQLQAWATSHVHPQSGPVPGFTGPTPQSAPDYPAAATSQSLSVPR